MGTLLTPTVERALKKLHKPQKLELAGAVRSVSEYPGFAIAEIAITQSCHPCSIASLGAAIPQPNEPSTKELLIL